ncbi:MAG: flagellar biosynthesis anti-sigma factor FlgM [Clostridiaceae bacterium]|nr:flagellar biosynthesis anti-sigma factor FlgM [Clostridiaceae bacterium]
MKITGVSSNDYLCIHSDSKKIVAKNTVSEKQDRLEISTVGKSLSSYSTDGSFGVSEEKLQGIRRQVSDGTYNRDSKLVAQKLIDLMKGRTI